MTNPTWSPEAPWMQFSDNNGEAIAEAMTSARNEGAAEDQVITIFVNPDYAGESLSLNQTFPGTDQIGRDRWRVPVGYWLNVRTGEVRDQDGASADWDSLVALG